MEEVAAVLLSDCFYSPTVAAVPPPATGDVSGSGDGSGSGSADHSASSGDISGESSSSGDISVSGGSGHGVAFSGDAKTWSGDQSASGSPQEAEGGSAVIFTSGELGSVSGSGSGYGYASGERLDGSHSGFIFSGSGLASGSGDLSGGSGDTVIIIVDGKVVEVTRPTTTEQELGQGGIQTSGEFLETSASGSGSGHISGSGFIYGSGTMSGSGSSASGSAEFSGISFIDHSAVDLTGEPSGEQELSGLQPFGSGFHSGFPSGFTSGASGSASASGDHSQHGSDIIFLTDRDTMQVTLPTLIRQPEQGRGVVEVSGQGSGSGFHHEFSGTLTEGSGVADELSAALPPEVPIGQTENDHILSQSQGMEEGQEPSEVAVTPDLVSTDPPTAPSVMLESPAVMEPPGVAQGG